MPLTDPSRPLTFGDVLSEQRHARPQGTAVVDGAVRFSWTELDERTARVAAGLSHAGVGVGDRVLWLGQNSYRVLELLGACARIGAILCPANWRSSPDELCFQVDDLEPTVVVWQQEDLGETAEKVRERTTSSSRWICHDAEDDSSYESVLASADPSEPLADIDAAAPVLAMYTAAFGGTPNAALLSHTAVLTQGLVMGRMLEISDEAVFLNSGPLFHIATLMVTMSIAQHGGCNVFIPRVDAEEICRLIDQESVTHGFLVGPTIEQMREANADGRFDLSSLMDSVDPDRYRGGIVGPPTSPWMKKPGGFGQTEVMGLCTFAGLGQASEGASGRSSPASLVRIWDESGAEPPVGEAGEIVVRGPIVTSGYFRRPDLSAVRGRDGWHHTGDLGRRETDGSISFVGPMTKMIKSAAENIYPAEVEAALQSHPAVTSACVIGVPDPEWSQRVKAVVTIVDGATLEVEELIEHCQERIASYTKPREIVFVEELPRTGPGLVDRDAVDEAHGGGGYPGTGR